MKRFFLEISVAKNVNQLPPLEDALLRCMKALDSQVAREMQRTPEEVSTQGVQKWEPISKRIEIVASFLLDQIGSEEIQIDSLLIMAQALSKTLYLYAEELGEKGLGKVRTGYCLHAFEQINSDAERGIQSLKGEQDVM